MIAPSTSKLSQLRAEIERLDKATMPGPWEIDKYNAVPDAPYVWTGSGLLELVGLEDKTDTLLSKVAGEWKDQNASSSFIQVITPKKRAISKTRAMERKAQNII